MHGNVWEWCHDWFGKDYYGKSQGDNPVNTSDASGCRVLRGGGWSDSGFCCRSASRSGSTPTSRFNCIGFRVVAFRSVGP